MNTLHPMRFFPTISQVQQSKHFFFFFQNSRKQITRSNRKDNRNSINIYRYLFSRYKVQNSSRKVIYTSHGNFCGSYSRIDERRRVIFGMLSNTKTFSSRIKWIISIHERINSSLFIRWSDSSGYVWIERERERARLKKKDEEERWK